jgi:hypothetical protein
MVILVMTLDLIKPSFSEEAVVHFNLMTSYLGNTICEDYEGYVKVNISRFDTPYALALGQHILVPAPYPAHTYHSSL